MDEWRSSWLPRVLFDAPAVFALRGVSGSGKSHVAREICVHRGGDCVIASADDFFIGSDGIYVFDGALLRDAHATCQAKVREAMERGVRTIVVDNTHLAAWELAAIERVVTAAATNKHHTFIVVEIGFEAAAAVAALGFVRNVHDVPWVSVCGQFARFESDERALRVPLYVTPAEKLFLASSDEARERVAEAEAARIAIVAAETARVARVAANAAEAVRIVATHRLRPDASEWIPPLATTTLAVPFPPVLSPRSARYVAFTALFLTQNSIQSLRQAAPTLNDAIFCADHVTLLHALTSAPMTQSLAALVGTRGRVKVRGFVARDGIVAATVAWSKRVRQQAAEDDTVSGDQVISDDDAGSLLIARAMLNAVSSMERDVPIPRHALGLNEYPHVTVALCPGIVARASNDVLMRLGGIMGSSLRPRLWLSVDFGVAVFDSTGVAGRLNISTASAWSEWLIKRGNRDREREERDGVSPRSGGGGGGAGASPTSGGAREAGTGTGTGGSQSPRRHEVFL